MKPKTGATMEVFKNTSHKTFVWPNTMGKHYFGLKSDVVV